MNIKQFKPRFTVLLLVTLCIGFIRVCTGINDDLVFLSNFSPVGAMAMFGGVYFKSRLKAILIPSLSLIFSSIILAFTVYKDLRAGLLYEGWYWVIAAFILMTLSSRLIMVEITIRGFFAASIVATLIHWLVTDLGVWMYSSELHGFAGYIECLVMAIPFELNFLLGTVFYGALSFGIFEKMQSKYHILRES